MSFANACSRSGWIRWLWIFFAVSLSSTLVQPDVPAVQAGRVSRPNGLGRGKASLFGHKQAHHLAMESPISSSSSSQNKKEDSDDENEQLVIFERLPWTDAEKTVILQFLSVTNCTYEYEDIRQLALTMGRNHRSVSSKINRDRKRFCTLIDTTIPATWCYSAAKAVALKPNEETLLTKPCESDLARKTLTSARMFSGWSEQEVATLTNLIREKNCMLVRKDLEIFASSLNRTTIGVREKFVEIRAKICYRPGYRNWELIDTKATNQEHADQSDEELVDAIDSLKPPKWSDAEFEAYKNFLIKHNCVIESTDVSNLEKKLSLSYEKIFYRLKKVRQGICISLPGGDWKLRFADPVTDDRKATFPKKGRKNGRVGMSDEQIARMVQLIVDRNCAISTHDFKALASEFNRASSAVYSQMYRLKKKLCDNESGSWTLRPNLDLKEYLEASGSPTIAPVLDLSDAEKSKRLKNATRHPRNATNPESLAKSPPKRKLESMEEEEEILLIDTSKTASDISDVSNDESSDSPSDSKDRSEVHVARQRPRLVSYMPPQLVEIRSGISKLDGRVDTRESIGPSLHQAKENADKLPFLPNSGMTEVEQLNHSSSRSSLADMDIMDMDLDLFLEGVFPAELITPRDRERDPFDTSPSLLPVNSDTISDVFPFEAGSHRLYRPDSFLNGLDKLPL